jgi:hypothetical protein
MVGKKMFFLKAFLRGDKLKDQVSFEDFLQTYSKEKLIAFANSDIHNDRNNEKELTLILFQATLERDEDHLREEAMNRVFDSIKYEIREHDILAKWDEESFIILLPECSEESAQKIAYLIKSIVESKTHVNMKVELDYAITVHENDDTPNSFMQRAEEELSKKCEEV